VSCTASSTVAIPAASGVTVTLDVSSGAAGTFTNGTTGCAADPAAALTESLETNNACNASPVSVVDVTIFDDGFELGPLPEGWTWASPP